ncbi:MAG: hypothetical protein R3D32_03455 [Nitratireductor sp.]
MRTHVGHSQGNSGRLESDRAEPLQPPDTISGILNVSPAWLLHGLGEAPQIDGVSDELKILKSQIQRLKELRAQTDRCWKTLKTQLSG